MTPETMNRLLAANHISDQCDFVQDLRKVGDRHDELVHYAVFTRHPNFTLARDPSTGVFFGRVHKAFSDMGLPYPYNNVVTVRIDKDGLPWEATFRFSNTADLK